MAHYASRITQLPCASLMAGNDAASVRTFLKPTRRYTIHMLRRFPLVAAATAMLALSALPASAAATQSSTHTLSFPGLHGVKAWGTYTRTSKGVHINVC